MTPPILIGIHGVKRAGKDTTADFFTEFAMESDPARSVVRRGFADKAKWAFARQFFPDITMDDAIAWVERYKESNRIFCVPAEGVPGVDTYTTGVVFRNGLARFATEGARDIYGDDFWVDQLLPVGMIIDGNDLPVYPRWHESFEWIGDPEGPKPADLCLIRDLRFENEVQRIDTLKRNGRCYSVKVKRKDAEDAVIEEARRQGRQVHRSELGLPDHLFDFVIDNSDNDLVLAKSRTLDIWEFINGR